jgi:hypothetical protein
MPSQGSLNSASGENDCQEKVSLESPQLSSVGCTSGAPQHIPDHNVPRSQKDPCSWARIQTLQASLIQITKN